MHVEKNPSSVTLYNVTQQDLEDLYRYIVKQLSYTNDLDLSVSATMQVLRVDPSLIHRPHVDDGRVDQKRERNAKYLSFIKNMLKGKD